jgi:hypothetical protein
LDVFLRQLWPADELVEGVESQDEVSIEGSDSSTPRHPSPIVLLDTPSTDCGSNDRADIGQQQTANKPSTL